MKLTIAEVLLVGEDENDGVAHLTVIDDPMQLLPRLVDSIAVGGVDDKNERLSARVVMSPKRPNLVLTSHILKAPPSFQNHPFMSSTTHPNIEFNILVCDRFDVESYSWYGSH
jgi:hypothetical protein